MTKAPTWEPDFRTIELVRVELESEPFAGYQAALVAGWKAPARRCGGPLNGAGRCAPRGASPAGGVSSGRDARLDWWRSCERR
jgi:hypothetical protein